MFFKESILWVFISFILLSFKSFSIEKSKLKTTSIEVETRATIVKPTKILNDIEIKNNTLSIENENIKNITIDGEKVKKKNSYIYSHKLKNPKKKFIRVGIEI